MSTTIICLLSDMENVFAQVRRASRELLALTDLEVKAVLENLADSLQKRSPELLFANGEDLARMSPDDPKYDRLMLTEARIAGIAQGLRDVASLPSPLGRELSSSVRPNGLHVHRVSVPFGVIGVIYEARPNVTFDVFGLCFRSGNACVLKGGKDAKRTNQAAIAIIHHVLSNHGVNIHAAELLPSTREAAASLMNARGFVDLIIPRGGSALIHSVRENSSVPVIETGAGVCHTYFDASGSAGMAASLVLNAKTRRVSVCNALDCLIVHRSRLAELPAVCGGLADRGVEIYADTESFAALRSTYPFDLLKHAAPSSYGTEFLDYKMAVKTVGSLEEAIEHISTYGSGHSEAIITSDETAAASFQRDVDAACVYVNAPTSFSDGGEFGLGAEIGISTQKLHARGPMGLEELTTYKWLIDGEGQVRP